VPETIPDSVPAPPSPPHRHECLWCYLDRVVDVHGCHQHQLTTAWAEHRGRPVKPLLTWAKNSHGYCDCEVLTNSFAMAWTLPEDLMCAVARGEAVDLAEDCPDCDGG
jgi:hypothetical protein